LSSGSGESDLGDGDANKKGSGLKSVSKAQRLKEFPDKSLIERKTGHLHLLSVSFPSCASSSPPLSDHLWKIW